MYISKVSLVNYRNFKNSKFIFNKGINTVIGENASGKTNLFRAIRLLLDQNLIQYSYKLNENDFNRSLGNNWKGHWIIISLEFDEVSSDEAVQALFLHGLGNGKDKVVEKATYNLFFRPKADIRKKLSELSNGDNLGLKALLDSITIRDNYETFFTGKSSVDFNDPNIYKVLVGDFEQVVFPAEIDNSKFGGKIPHQLSVSNEISFTFIQALRDVVGSFHNNNTNPLLKLLKDMSGGIKKEAYEPINSLIKEVNKQIEELDDVKQIRDDIESTIQDTVGKTYSPSTLLIQSSLSDESEKLLQSLKLFIGESDDKHPGEINELSLGGANLIFLTLKLLEFKYQKNNNSFANFLIIEEPEAHIHNHIQKTIFDKLDYENTQIIYSTHSTQISEVSKIKNMNIISRASNYTEVFQPSFDLKPEQITHVERYLDSVRTNLLFAKGVILIEGDAEEILIPIIVKKVLGLSLDELGLSLINIRSTGFKNVALLFHDNRIKNKCSIITDLDKAICDTTADVNDTKEVASYKIKVGNSEKKGIERKEALYIFTNGNNWINTFYAKHTFEVDFLMNSNSWEVINIIDNIYTDKGTRVLAKKELNSKEVAIAGRRILTMAKQEGKGWFAILLGKHININTVIPSYILDAIFFAKGKFNNRLIGDIIKYRVSELIKNEEDTDKIQKIEEIIFSIEEYQKEKVTIDELSSIIANDPETNGQTYRILKGLKDYV